jgi:cytochrome c-type biogenesis protein CcmF
VLGWGGYWAWDPVENASLLPWLTGTAYLHSVMVQERRGMLRVWNLSLLCATFALTILGTFLTRSGVLDSVHAFTESPSAPGCWRSSPSSSSSPSASSAGAATACAPGPHRLAAVARGRVPRQQRAVRRLRLRRAARHRVPAAGRGLNDRAALGRPAVLQPDDHAHRAHAAVPHGVAPVLPWRKASASCCAAPAVAGVGSATGAGVVVAVAVGARGLGAAAGLRPRRLRRRVGACASSCWPPAAGLAGFVGRANGGMIVHLGVIMIAVTADPDHDPDTVPDADPDPEPVGAGR